MGPLTSLKWASFGNSLILNISLPVLTAQNQLWFLFIDLYPSISELNENNRYPSPFETVFVRQKKPNWLIQILTIFV